MKSIYFLLAFFLSLISIETAAQTPAWAWVKSGVGGFDLATDKLGNVYVTGSTIGTLSLQKLSPSGDSIWAKYFTNSTANAITVDGFGNVYIIGECSGTVTFDSIQLTGQGGSFITKLDSAGNVIWAKKCGGIQTSFQVAADAEGNAYFGGKFTGTAVFENDSIAGVHDLFVVKYNGDGSLGWVRNIPVDSTSSYNSFFWGVTADEGNHIYFSGFADKHIVLGQDTLNPNVGMFYAKMNKDGDFVWAKTFAAHAAASIATDSLSNIYIGGTKNNDQSFIAKFDSSGSFIWSNDVGQPFYSPFIKSGRSGSVYTTAVYGGATVKFDTDGNLAWAKYHPGSSFFACPDVNGDVYTTGSYSNTAYFLPYVLTGAGYNVSVPFLGKLSFTTGVNEVLNEDHRMLVYPNPSPGIFNILTKDNNATRITVYNSLGKICYAHPEEIKDQYTSINLEHLSTGIYFLELKNKEHSAVQKLIIQR